MSARRGPGSPNQPRAFLGLAQVPADLGPTVVTIGVFDGVHRGHQALLGQVVDQAAARGITAGAITFDRHPIEVVGPGTRVPMLSTLRQRIALLGAAGMEFVTVLPFTLRLSRMPAEEFAIKVLLEAVSARAIVVGANFRFGHRATGNPELLAELASPRGADVIAVPLNGDGGEAISSTRIRAALAQGDVGTAARLLGRPFALEGHVIRGDQRGRLLGVPTANLRVPARLALPARGIYAGHLETGGSGPLPAVSSVGVNPQFGGSDLRVEAHVLDFDGDLYDRRVKLSFEHHLRDEAAFPDVAALVAQMERDIRRARELLGGAGAR
ncbi:MAG TPA: bifunctional riboflavin kinase/FAD synthetase [Actinomycetes bacterium]|jgi:riboflavin kinase/FMN adenylyltransferase|nr:bifunctional riboflavin kinase/FAD synthetase [Actinomycetes bacterium]